MTLIWATEKGEITAVVDDQASCAEQPGFGEFLTGAREAERQTRKSSCADLAKN